MIIRKMRFDKERFCEVEIKLVDGRFSISGTEGRIESCLDAKRDAIESWESFFKEQPEEIKAMNQRCGTNFRSPKTAARYVLETDGEFHGLDVVRENDKQVFIAESCGQIRDEISKWFPEVIPYYKYHLNDWKRIELPKEVYGFMNRFSKVI